MTNPNNDQRPQQAAGSDELTYDYIIVGAGSSGCVLANRLSADPAVRVLLIEEGGKNNHPYIRMAGGFVKIIGNPRFYRSYTTSNPPGLRSEKHAYGRGLGGSSAVNGTWYLTGMPDDYADWVEQGNPGWNWEQMSRCFQRIESFREPGAWPGRGREGEVEITYSDHESPVFDALVKAFGSQGMPWVDDITTPGIVGAGRSQYTVDRRGRRVTSATAFLDPIRGRRNLTVVTDTGVKRLILEGSAVKGVLCDRDGQEVAFYSRLETILSAGVYGSPQLLQLSGIGPSEVLQGLGISSAVQSSQVGRNLAEHQKLGISFDLRGHPGMNREFLGWRLYRNALRYFSLGTGPLARIGLPLTGLYSSEGNTKWPDFQVAAAAFAMRTVAEMAAKPGSPISDRPGLTISGYHLRPRSRGVVRLQSQDFRSPPHIEVNRWSDPYDQAKALELLKLMRSIAHSPAMADFTGSERVPGGEIVDDKALINALSQMVEAGLHGTGTCKMGPDPATSVVDDRCRVHGVRGLRVVDCSIIPVAISGNTNGPAMAVGQRASELLIEDRRGRRRP